MNSLVHWFLYWNNHNEILFCNRDTFGFRINLQKKFKRSQTVIQCTHFLRLNVIKIFYMIHNFFNFFKWSIIQYPLPFMMLSWLNKKVHFLFLTLWANKHIRLTINLVVKAITMIPILTFITKQHVSWTLRWWTNLAFFHVVKL